MTLLPHLILPVITHCFLYYHVYYLLLLLLLLIIVVVVIYTINIDSSFEFDSNYYHTSFVCVCACVWKSESHVASCQLTSKTKVRFIIPAICPRLLLHVLPRLHLLRLRLRVLQGSHALLLLSWFSVGAIWGQTYACEWGGTQSKDSVQ